MNTVFAASLGELGGMFRWQGRGEALTLERELVRVRICQHAYCASRERPPACCRLRNVSSVMRRAEAGTSMKRGHRDNMAEVCYQETGVCILDQQLPCWREHAATTPHYSLRTQCSQNAWPQITLRETR